MEHETWLIWWLIILSLVLPLKTTSIIKNLFFAVSWRGTSTHWLRGMFWHCSCGKNSQRSRGTLTQLWRGTFWHDSRGTSTQFWRGTLRHSCRGKEVHCVSGTLVHTCRGTFLHVLQYINDKYWLGKRTFVFLLLNKKLRQSKNLTSASLNLLENFHSDSFSRNNSAAAQNKHADKDRTTYFCGLLVQSPWPGWHVRFGTVLH
jgi:hypothetical protein